MKMRQAFAAVEKSQLWLTAVFLCIIATSFCMVFVLVTKSALHVSKEEYQLFENSETPFASSTRVIILQAGEGVEYKLDIDKGKAFVYSWSASDPLYYDLHAEPTTEEGKAFLPLKSYEIDTVDQSSGQLVTEFSGNHGWYWLNRSNAPISITVAVAGFYKRTGLMTGGH